MPLTITTPFTTPPAASFTLSGATYNGVGADFPSISANPFGLFFKPDGTRMFTWFTGPQYSFAQFDMAPAWDITTNTLNANRFIGVSHAINSGSLSLSSDGLKIFTVWSTLAKAWDLPGPWTVNAMNTTVDQQINIQTLSDGTSSFTGHAFSPDGTKLFAGASNTGLVHQFSLSTPWDLTTLTYDSKSFSIASQITSGVADMEFKPDGTKMFVLDTARKLVEYDLSVAWDVSTASFGGVQISDTNPLNSNIATGLAFKDDGTKVYIVHLLTVPGFEIYEWDL